MAMSRGDGDDRDRNRGEPSEGSKEDEEPFFGLGTITTRGDRDLERRAQRLRAERGDDEDDG